MIKISDYLYVAACEITSIEIDTNDHIIATLKGGRAMSVPNDYGKSCYTTLARLVNEISAARKGEQNA